MRLYVCCQFWLGNNFLSRKLTQKRHEHNTVIKLWSAFLHALFATALIMCADLIEGTVHCVFNAFLAISAIILSGITVQALRKVPCYQRLWKHCFWVFLSLILVLVFLSSLSTVGYLSSSYSEAIQLMLHAPQFTCLWARFLIRTCGELYWATTNSSGCCFLL